MAAKPPKPPGNFLNSNNSNNNCSDNNITITPCASENQCDNNDAYNNNDNREEQQLNEQVNRLRVSKRQETTATTAPTPTPTPACQCTNISIMHLFHEMKQEFPTIPDHIVAQCVNENCHQREKCVRALRHELALNPMPVQAYPAKQLLLQQQQQRPQQQQQQQQQLNEQVNRLKNILKPTRIAPSVPSTPPTARIPNCDSQEHQRAESAQQQQQQQQEKQSINSNSDSILKYRVYKPHSVSDNRNCTTDVSSAQSSRKETKFSDSIDERVRGDISMPAIVNERQQKYQQPPPPSEAPPPPLPTTAPPTTISEPPQPQPPPPRARPTTLNLQQRQQQLPPHQQPSLPQQPKRPQKPLRKAPLPPKSLANQQAQIHFNNTNSIGHLNGNNNSSSNNNNNNNNNKSNESSCVNSPSSGSEISVNVSLSSPSAASIDVGINGGPIGEQQLKSPVRHRSVINVQPALPYTRDYLNSPTKTTSGSITSTPSTLSSPTQGSNQKSFTSVNLTLRQPTTVGTPTSAPPVGGGALTNAGNAGALTQSTIDITASPNGSGASGGLTYSSTSYNAKLGLQQEFHITVNGNGGGVISASRLRPQHGGYVGQHDVLGTDGDGLSGAGGGGGGSAGAGALSPMRESLMLQQQLQQQQIIQQQQQYLSNSQQLQQQQHQQQLHATGGDDDGSVTKESSAVEETLQRQKERRDKLASELRDKKKRLYQVEQQITILIDVTPAGESERLDSEIEQLRIDCQAMLNELENARKCDPSTNLGYSQNQNSVNHSSRQSPFPPQRHHRPPRPPPPVSRQQTPNLDFIQHHQPAYHSNSSASSTPTPSSAYATPTSVSGASAYGTPTQYHPHHPSPTYQQQLYQQQLSAPANNQQYPPLYQQQQSHQHLHHQSSPQQQPIQYQQQHSLPAYHQQPHQSMSPFQRNPSIPLPMRRHADLYEDDVVDDDVDADAGNADADNDLVDDDDDEEEESLETWECNMCTFRNHPQLNICECCENIRILPGTLRLAASSSANAIATNTNTANNQNATAAAAAPATS